MIDAFIEKADPKKVHTLRKALEAVLMERGLMEKQTDWVDKETNQVIIDGSLFYELLSKASEKMLSKRKKENPDDERDIGENKVAKETTRQSEEPKHWWQKGQYK